MRRMLLPVSMMLALSSGVRGPAQGQTSSTTLTGSWNVTAYGPDGKPALITLFTCHPDGTVTAILRASAIALEPALWVSTGNGQFGMTTLHFDLNPPPSNDPLNGFLKLRYSINVSGATMTGSAEAINLDLTGAVLKDTTGITLTGAPIGVEQIGAPLM